MKKIYILIIFCTSNFIFCQNDIKTDVPNIIPPSPTSSSLMKFEEIPVSHYTGVPDVNIPLINIPTHAKDKNINISLNYHPASIASDNIASDVGLGWNLMYGGTISRTVKGQPDEILYKTGSEDDAKIGIYQTSTNSTNNTNNPFYYFSDNVLNEYKNYQKPYLNSSDTEIGNEFIWTATRTNKYDTEHDLWQFNFLGNTGRFYIKKNLDNNSLQVIPLDNNNFKIINIYDTSTYKPIGFEIYDDKGYKYIFDIVEKSLNNGGVKTTTYVDNGFGSVMLVPQQSLFTEAEFISSFHLSKITDNNNIELARYKYKDDVIKESFTKFNKVIADGIPINSYRDSNKCQELPPVETLYRSSTIVEVKKIDTIYINNIAKIHFKFNQGRSDDNIDSPHLASYLESISLYDWNSTLQKKYKLSYKYSKVINTRMMLDKVTEYDKQDQLIGKYELSYKEPKNADNGVIGKDKWGYFNLTSVCQNSSPEELRQVSPQFSSTDILQKIKYPTGGCTIFDYESNQFSYIGDQSVQGKVAYKFLNTISESLYVNNNAYFIPNHSKNRKFIIYPGMVDAHALNRVIKLEKLNGSTWETVTNIDCLSQNPHCCIEVLIDKNYSYRVRRTNFNIPDNEVDSFSIDVYEESGNDFSQFGGGNRIKRIGYFKVDTPIEYYDDNYFPSHSPNNPPLTKEISYNYNEIGNIEKSSGSLVNKIPEFEYYHSYYTKFYFGPYDAASFCNGTINVNTGNSVLMKTTDNNFKFFQTKGGDVGYKNVTVSELNKGKSVYTFTSAFDYPADNTISGPPFVKPKDYDYKRGLLKSLEVYNNIGQKLVETTNAYSIDDYSEYLGVKFQPPVEIYNGKHQSYPSKYSLYKSSLNNLCMSCVPNYFTDITYWGGLPLDSNTPNFSITPSFETYGWVKLISKREKKYFYQNGTQKVLETNESFEYNPLNKMTSQHIINTPDGNEQKSKYYYHFGNSIYSQNRISEIEKVENFKNGKLLNTKIINYGNSWNGNSSYLPYFVQSSFGESNLETEIRYDNYDDKGNLLQYTTKSGLTTIIIWGYNKTQPIAKIEGAGFRITNGISLDFAILINKAIEESDEDISSGSNSDEVELLSALHNLRQSQWVQDALVTTYSYDPLIGVRSITPPSGIRESYIYDTANRLEKIVDVNGKVLKEFKYNYKN